MENTTAQPTHNLTAGDRAIDRDGRLVRISAIHREDGVDFAWVRYIDGDGPDPAGRVAGTEEAPLFEHRLDDGEVQGPDGFYGAWVPEAGLRPAPASTFPTVVELELELDGQRAEAGDRYVDLAEGAYNGALLGDLALLIARADAERRAVSFTLAELRALEAARFMDGTTLTQAGRQAAAAAAVARQGL